MLTNKRISVALCLLLGFGFFLNISTVSAHPHGHHADQEKVQFLLPDGVTRAELDASRLVTASNSVTETIFALGLGERVVGTDTSSVHPERVKQLPKVGYHAQVSVEGILSLGPTLVIAGERFGPESAAEQLRQSGVAVLMINTAGSEQPAIALTETLAKYLDCGEAAEKICKEIAKELAAARALSDSAQRHPQVLFLMANSAQRLMAAGGHTQADRLLALVGAENVIDAFDGYKPLTPESAIALDPEWIVATRMSEEAFDLKAALERHPALGQTRAVKAGRVISGDAAALLTAGPRIGEVAHDLARQLYTTGKDE